MRCMQFALRCYGYLEDLIGNGRTILLSTVKDENCADEDRWN
jgi:hypothetical protein